MQILQCPECKLRFRYESELDQHLKDEHPAFHAESLDDRLPHRPRHHERHYESSN